MCVAFSDKPEERRVLLFMLIKCQKKIKLSTEQYNVSKLLLIIKFMVIGKINRKAHLTGLIRPDPCNTINIRVDDQYKHKPEGATYLERDKENIVRHEFVIRTN